MRVINSVYGYYWLLYITETGGRRTFLGSRQIVIRTRPFFIIIIIIISFSPPRFSILINSARLSSFCFVSTRSIRTRTAGTGRERKRARPRQLKNRNEKKRKGTKKQSTVHEPENESICPLFSFARFIETYSRTGRKELKRAAADLFVILFRSRPPSTRVLPRPARGSRVISRFHYRTVSSP